MTCFCVLSIAKETSYHLRFCKPRRIPATIRAAMLATWIIFVITTSQAVPRLQRRGVVMWSARRSKSAARCDVGAADNVSEAGHQLPRSSGSLRSYEGVTQDESAVRKEERQGTARVAMELDRPAPLMSWFLRSHTFPFRCRRRRIAKVERVHVGEANCRARQRAHAVTISAIGRSTTLQRACSISESLALVPSLPIRLARTTNTHSPSTLLAGMFWIWFEERQPFIAATKPTGLLRPQTLHRDVDERPSQGHLVSLDVSDCGGDVRTATKRERRRMLLELTGRSS